MLASHGVLYPFLALASCVCFIYMSLGDLGFHLMEPQMGFVEREGTQLFVHGTAFYVNGWNSYWLMDQAVEEFSWPRVREVFEAAANLGLTVCRTWAFNDGSTHNALQVSPGRFDELVFRALDRVIVEAQRHGIRLLLSLGNDLEAYGGKSQYVRWAWEEGIGSSSSNDSFLSDPSIRSYFKAYLKAILTRRNHLNGVQYKDDPTIFAWELMNEPRCTSDATGDTLQNWIEEMAAYVKSIDKKHLLTIGLEGFYGPTSPPEKLSVNPIEYYSSMGSDFIRNSNVSAIDFTSVHIYPDQWLPGAEHGEKMRFLSKWVLSHIEDGDRVLKKPVLFSEFGLSDRNKNFSHSQRDEFYKTIFDIIYDSAQKNGAGGGAFVWQLVAEGMEEFHDDFAIVPGERPQLHRLIREQSCRLAAISHEHDLAKRRAKMIY